MAVGSAMASQFSRDGRYFAQLTADGRLKVWNTSTSAFEQEFTPDFHLTAPCTCLHFVQQDEAASQNHTPRKKKRKGAAEPAIALGTSSGLLMVYSINKAKLDFTIDSETGQSIGSISWHSGTVLYSTIDQNIVSWNLDKKSIRSKWKAGNEKLTAVLILPNGNNVLTASRNIKLWDVKRKEVVRVFTGHSYEVILLELVQTNTDMYIISGSKGDRLLSIWNLNERSSDKNSIANFLMEDIPASLSIVTRDGVSHLAVVTRSGVAHYYRHTLNGKCSKPLKPKTTIQVATDTSHSNSLVAPIPIMGAYLNDDLSIMIVHGSELILSFENVILNEYEKMQCLIRKDPRITSSRTSQEIKSSKVRTPVIDNNVHYLTPHTSSAVKRKNDGRQEVPMEKRLENLALNKPDSTLKVPKVDNVAQLLVQGLHSSDKTILRSVLSQHDEVVIKNTIRRLPMPVIVPLVQEVTKMVQGKTVSSQQGCIWLKNLLQVHTGLLLSYPDLSELLSPILGTIESRLSLLAPLNRLRGRLDLLVSQVSATNLQKSNETADDGALLVYNDKDTSDTESENLDIAPHSESDNEWMEESSEDENDQEDPDDDSDVEDMEM